MSVASFISAWKRHADMGKSATATASYQGCNHLANQPATFCTTGGADVAVHRRVSKQVIGERSLMLANRLFPLLAIGLLVACTQEADVDTPEPIAATPVLHSDIEKFSYVVALNTTQSIIADGAEVDAEAFALGARDAVAGTQPRLTADEMVEVLTKHQQTSDDSQSSEAEQNLQAAHDFLATNRGQEGVLETASGLQYKVQRQGEGALPTATDTVKVHYTGRLRTGEEFDSSERRGVPAKFPVNGVIKGWQEALQLMPVGSRWTVFVPPELGYGPSGAGSAIGPNELLVFEVELLSIEN